MKKRRNRMRAHKKIFHAFMLILLASVILSGIIYAQMFGIPELEQEPAAPAAAETSEGSLLQRQYARYWGEDSPYRPIILTVLTLILLINLKKFLTRRMRSQLSAKAFDQDNVSSFMKIWDGIWKFIIAIFAVLAVSGSLGLLGLTAGFLGMILGWSLQQPVTGIAAWIMIVLKKPFKIGDRVIIAGITGDVTSITLTHVILNQVGGSIAGEERSGRGILIPNAILFQNIIVNYTLEQEYMLDEVPVRITFDSDWEKAKKILLESAESVTSEVVTDNAQEPFIRCEFLDWGVLVRLRYLTIPARRQEISTLIIEKILQKVKSEYPSIKFAMPSSNVKYKQERPGDEVFPPAA